MYHRYTNLSEAERSKVVEKRAENEAEQVAKPPADTPEEAAEKQFQLAKQLFDQGRKDAARMRFHKIIEDFPGTKAAQQAQSLLTVAE